MASMDVLKGDAFSMMSLLEAIENTDHKPQYLGSLNLFTPKPQRLRVVGIESRDNELSLIQTSKVGAPLDQADRDRRKVRNFNTVRIAKGDRLMAEELQGIRAFGSETELSQVQEEIARRMQALVDDVELTWEHHRLGGVQGIVTDADGSTIVNFFTEFGVVQPDEVDFDFDAHASDVATIAWLRPLVENSIVRPMIRASKGAMTTSSRVIALCGDGFWDKLVNCPEVRGTFLNQQEAAELRKASVFGSFVYAGVEWVNYRGTDDGSTVAIGTNKVKFFPVGSNGIFQVAWGPGEFMPSVNMPGVPLLPMVVPDEKRQAYADIEVYSYPLFVCTKPLTLRRGTYTPAT